MIVKQDLINPDNAKSLEWLLSHFEELRAGYCNFAPTKTESVETLGLWFQRTIKHGVNPKTVNYPSLSTIDELICLSVDRWTDGDPAYKGALMRTMKEALIFRFTIYGPQNFSDIVRHAVAFIKTSPKMTFGVLELFARSTPESALWTVETLDTGFFLDAFSILARQPQRGGSVGRCIAALLSEADPQVWFDFSAPHLSVASEQQNVIVYFLEPSLKQSKAALPKFAKFFELCKSMKDASIEIACLKAALNANLDISEYVNGSSVLEESLKALSKPLRYDALSLVCRATRKLTMPIPAETFRLIQDNADSLFAEGDPQSRADVLSCLRHLMLRINTSTRKHDPKDSLSFIDFILEWSATSLQPGMPYRCLAMAAGFLKLLSDHSVDVYTSKVLSSLLNCVASDYGDIREASVSLLQKAPSLSIVETRFDELVATALNLLSHSRSGDAGARLLAFLNTCKPNANLGAVVVAAISTATSFAKRDLLAAAKDHSLHGFFIALRILPYCSGTVVPLVCEAWDACNGPLLVNAPEGTEDEVMNYCWKTVKESCALVEFLAINDAAKIGELQSLIQRLASMLTDITHWGAFSAVPPAFRAVAMINPDISSKIIWEELESLRSGRRARSVTRRSAGLPLLVTSALLVRFEAQIIETLFEISLMESEEINEDLALPQVHGMNCINAFVTDAQLAKRSAPYIERALYLALLRYKSPAWSLRNCAAMLFSKLHTRLFGVKAPKMAAKVFFMRYKSLRSLLKEELNSKTRESDLHSVYPALAIIANLQTSLDDDALDEFWEPLARLLASRSWKVREMAARALSAATPVEMVCDATIVLIKTLSGKDQNLMHGIGLAINELWSDRAFAFSDEHFKDHLANIIRSNNALEVNCELYKAWLKLGGRGRLVEFESLPRPPQLNPSIATFEAEQAKQSVVSVSRYGKLEWAAVLRALPDDKWDTELSKIVLSNVGLPDVQSRCLQALQKMRYSGEFGSLAVSLLSAEHPQSVRQQALVLASKASDLEVDSWLRTLEEFSRDEAAIESRKSAVSSIGAFLKGPLNAAALSDTRRSTLFYRLFKLLSDDEEIVRQEAALVASQHLGTRPLAAPACEGGILSEVNGRYITSQLVHNLGADAEKARVSYEDPSDVLFVVEKESLFRDELRNIALQGRYCSHVSDVPASRMLEGLDWQSPFQASANSQLLEIRARLDAVRG